MQEMQFIQDLAIIMLVAGVTTIIFYRFKQPVVLGYIIAGIIIGPHTPPFTFIHDQHTIKIFANLGVIFLMFSLGLEFSLRKLSKVGIAALFAVLFEIVVMIAIGYSIGRAFHWRPIDALFLGAMIAISSSTIIVKALNELKLQKEGFVQLIYGLLIMEDILAIAILALLSSIAATHTINVTDVVLTLSKLMLFLVVALSVGILIVPRLLAYVAKFNNREMLLVTVLALCFGFCLLTVSFDYSIVLGSFVIGAIIAESRYLKTIEHLIEPLRTMFSAVFFVAIGLMFDIKALMEYIVPVLVISVSFIVGKVLACSLGMFMTGRPGKTALRVGMGVAQIGEFSFIIATLGISLHLTNAFLYPIAVGVSAITTITTPYLIRSAEPLAEFIARVMPRRVVYIFRIYTEWLQNLQPKRESSEITRIIRRSAINIVINLALVTTIFLATSYFVGSDNKYLLFIANDNLLKTVLWGSALFISLPFLIATYRKLKALSMLLAEFSVREQVVGRFTVHTRKLVAELVPIVSMMGVLLFIGALSGSILPPTQWLLLVLLIIAGLTAFLWRWFIKLHSRLQISLMETIENK